EVASFVKGSMTNRFVKLVVEVTRPDNQVLSNKDNPFAFWIQTDTGNEIKKCLPANITPITTYRVGPGRHCDIGGSWGWRDSGCWPAHDVANIPADTSCPAGSTAFGSNGCYFPNNATGKSNPKYPKE